LESFSDRLRMARLLFKSAHIRLTTEEAYHVHTDIIEWDKTFSETKIPDQAVGLDALNIKMMKQVMSSWQKVQFFNRFLAGTLTPRIQLDFLPSLFCGAHFMITRNDQLQSAQDYLEGGRAMQRVWLKAAQLGLRVQPEMTPLIFTHYIDEGIAFSKNKTAIATAEKVRASMNDFVGEENRKQAVFLGRMGTGAMPTSRSTRKSLHSLMDV
jgi:sulfur-carrier protein adenylyltransferase/sulfurtransferase